MWYSPTQRRGFASCSPLAYALNVLGCWLANIGLVLVCVAINGALVVGFFGGWSWMLALVLIGSAAVPAMGWTLMGLAWWMVKRLGYRFDPVTDSCVWNRGNIQGEPRAPGRKTSG